MINIIGIVSLLVFLSPVFYGIYKSIKERIEDRNGGFIMENNQNKSFWTDKKNIAITVLSVLLVMFFGLYCSEKNTTLPASATPALEDQTTSLSNQLAEANEKITTLGTQNNELTQKNQELTNQINSTGDLQKQLDEKNGYIFNLEEQVGILTAEKSQLENQVSLLSQKSSSSGSTTSSSSTSSSTPSTSSTQTTSYTVYITNTGSKYHRSGCRYLKQSSHAIDKDDAISQGYTACSVCNP